MIEHPFLKPSLVFNLQKRKLKGELLLERPPECCARDLGVREELPSRPEKRPVPLLIRNPDSEAPVKFPIHLAPMNSAGVERPAEIEENSLHETFTDLPPAEELLLRSSSCMTVTASSRRSPERFPLSTLSKYCFRSKAYQPTYWLLSDTSGIGISRDPAWSTCTSLDPSYDRLPVVPTTVTLFARRAAAHVRLSCIIIPLYSSVTSAVSSTP